MDGDDFLPVLTIKTTDGDRHVEFSPGQSLRDILDLTSYRVRSGCRGTGACGLCRVRTVLDGLDEATLAERLYLSSDQLATGVRLACQVKPKQSLEVTVLNQAPLSKWKTINPCHHTGLHLRELPGCPPAGLPGDVKNPFGVAIDLGTTHISLAFRDLLTGEWITGRFGLNPQGEYGTDVITRLTAACESREHAGALRRHAVDAVGDAIADIAGREGISPEQVVKIVLCGNTAMTALLSGKNYDLLLKPAQWMRYIDCLPEDTSEYTRIWGIHPEAGVHILPPIAGFVGSDLTAGILATRLTESEPGTLLIDFGTNSEVALWDGKSLWVTSAAGGPAFEGCGISCGMPAESGAIYQVRSLNGGDRGSSGVSGSTSSRDDTDKGTGYPMPISPGLTLYSRTIDGENPAGLCGSGIVDVIACLVRSGKLTSMGRFSPDVGQKGLTLFNGERNLVLTKKDVDAFQRAKAAVSAAIMILLSKARMSSSELGKVFIGGAFGRFLTRADAVETGLLPDMEPQNISLCSNTALAGCELLLSSPEPGNCLKEAVAGAKVINLSQEADFNDFFLEGLYLRRWSNQ